MRLSKIHVIINPAAGAEEPILVYINEVFAAAGISWEISVTHGAGDAAASAHEWKDQVDAIVVYGGDGSISEVAQALSGSQTPLAIIPGGTANVIARELGIPLKSKEAIEWLAGGEWQVKTIDVATANGELFLIRVNFGIMSDMIVEANRELKSTMGQLAYGMTAVKSILQSEVQQYEIRIDGNLYSDKAVALTVTNCASIGIGDYAFIPGIAVDDGLLDIILLPNADLFSVLRLVGSTLRQNDSSVLRHWKGKEIEISFDRARSYLLDDAERKGSSIQIKVTPGALRIIAPTK